jgi:hypothetical protein
MIAGNDRLAERVSDVAPAEQPRIPQLHGMAFATGIPVVLRSDAFRFSRPENLARGCLQHIHRPRQVT